MAGARRLPSIYLRDNKIAPERAIHHSVVDQTGEELNRDIGYLKGIHELLQGVADLSLIDTTPVG